MTTSRLSLGFVWKGHFNKAIGYGEEARQFCYAMEKSGIPFTPNLLKVSLDGRQNVDDENEQRIYREFIEQLPQKTSKVDCFIAVSHSLPWFFSRDSNARANVARCMFETDRLPDEWLTECLKMDAVWVPSDFNMESYRRAGIPKKKLSKLPGTINSQVYSPIGPVAEIVPGRRFKFFSLFEWSLRKGWDILVEAFLEEFSETEPVSLIIKTWSTMGIDYKMELNDKIKSHFGRTTASIILLDKAYFPEVMPSVYRGMHCFVLPSHGEGWGRPYMEAMSCGLPTIATGWSGNTEFMNQENSFLLDYELTPVSDAVSQEVPTFKGHRWAHPDKTQLRVHMRHCYENYDEAKEIGLKGRKHIEENFSYAPISQILKQKLKQYE